MRHIRALIRLVLVVLWIVAVCTLGTFTYLFSYRRLHPRVVMLCNLGELFFLGVKVRITGDPPVDPRGILFVANHCSYLDIPVYGSILPVCYTPKAEIKRWPLLGQFTILARSVFITREKDASASQRDKLRAELALGENILLFPEGTTNDGEHIKPFKSALFSVAEPQGGQPAIPVLALALRYRVYGKPPKNGRLLDRVAWYGDMVMLPHLWALLTMERVEAEVHFFPAAPWQGSRKEMAAHYGEMVAKMVGEEGFEPPTKAL